MPQPTDCSGMKTRPATGSTLRRAIRRREYCTRVRLTGGDIRCWRPTKTAETGNILNARRARGRVVSASHASGRRLVPAYSQGFQNNIVRPGDQRNWMRACKLWHGLWLETRDSRWRTALHKALRFQMEVQFVNPRDANLEGAVLERTLPPDGTDRSPYHVRDLASIFFVQAAALERTIL